MFTVVALRSGVCGIHHKLAVHASHAHRSNNGTKRNVRQGHSRRSRIDSDHIGIVLLIRGENQSNQLCFIAKSIREQRAQGPIDLTARQDFLFAGPPFALDESAGNASAGICVLAVVHREREEVDAFPGIGRCHRSGQNNCFAGRYQRCARGLLGHAAGLKDQSLAAG